MSSNENPAVSRRRVLQAGVAASVAIAMRGALAADAKALPPVLKSIPSTGEKIPAVGIGTNAFGVTSAEELAELKKVLQGLSEQGGRVVDTARGYGSSEEVIGKLLTDIGNRDRIFLATKTPLAGDVSAGKPVLDESFRRLQVSKIDLLQVHNMNGMDSLMPHFREYKAAGKIRYIGMTTSQDGQYGPIMQAMRTHKPDFVQVDYSVGNRGGAVDDVLKLAQEIGAGVLINSPFGGRGRTMFPRVANVAVPEWAKEFDATTWAQFFLKYIISHPAVTAAIPGTTTVAYLLDNQAGGRGRLPNGAQRKKMEEFWDSLPG
jgi:aryl-alcohol dehydrogenase-like predicted oxidoreductase